MDLILIVFFFKQKTAYEMRISDWSSDVCSSDLRDGAEPAGTRTMDRVRSVQLQPKYPDRCPDAATGQQSDPHAPEPGAEPDQSGPQSGHQIGRASCRERVCQYV